MKYLSFVLLLVFISSCSNKNKQAGITTFKIDLKENNVSSLNEIVNFKKFIQLESHPEAIIGNIGRIFITNNSEILIFDKKGKCVLLFSESGKFIRKIGRIGNGPKELFDPQDLTFDKNKNELYVLNTNNSIKVFNTLGEFLKTIKLGFWGSSICFYDDKLLVHKSSDTNDNNLYSLNIISLEGNIINQQLPLIPAESGFNFLNMNSFVQNKNEIKYIRPFDYNVYSFNGNDFRTALKFDFGKNNAPENFISTIKSRQDFLKFIQSSNYVHSLISFLETEQNDYVRIDWKGNTYSIYLNKETGAIKKYFHKNLHDLFVQVAPIAVHNNNFINVFYPYYTKSAGVNYPFRMKYMQNKVDGYLYSQFEKIIGMELTENPVLIFTTPKFQ